MDLTLSVGSWVDPILTVGIDGGGGGGVLDWGVITHIYWLIR